MIHGRGRGLAAQTESRGAECQTGVNVERPQRVRRRTVGVVEAGHKEVVGTDMAVAERTGELGCGSACGLGTLGPVRRDE